MATTTVSSSGTTTATPPSVVPGSASGIYNQPAFDSRIRRLSQPFGTGTTPIQRGYMIWDPSVSWIAPYDSSVGFAGAPKVLFLYNPSTIEATYTISNNSLMSSLLYPTTTLDVTARVMLQQSVEFTIMFDRTYEMNSANQSANMKQFGVELDVLAMKQFTGMFASLSNDGKASSTDSNPTTGIPSGVNSADPAKSLNGIMQGVMQVAYSYVEFAPGTGLQYYGYVSEWDVSYTHFNQQMIPMRCVIDVSFTLMPPPSGNAQGSIATAASQVSNVTPATGVGGNNGGQLPPGTFA
jgi:hypothetical protein